MAYLIMPTLGEPMTCDVPCAHKDCAWWRSIVGSPCTICTQPVEAEDRFHYDAPPNDAVMHARCYEEKVAPALPKSDHQ